MNKKLLIVDGNSIINRAFYAISGSRMLTRSDGTPTNAVYGFINIFNKYMEEEKPDFVAVAFDLKAKTFRSELYVDYKAHRKGMPDELAIQLPMVKEVLNAMNVSIIEKEGLEADDLIGIYSKIAEEQGIQVVILTGDRDALQLVSDMVTVVIPSTSKGFTSTARYTPETVKNEYGVEPKSLIDVKALMGDPSDNIPGVKGVGQKTALLLIKEFGSLDGVYENLSAIEKPSLRKNLEEGREMAYLSRTLGTIIREKDGMQDISDFKKKEINRKELFEVFKKLEFNSLINKLGLTGQYEPAVELEEAEFETIKDTEKAIRIFEELSHEGKLYLLHVIEPSERVGGKLKSLAAGTSNKHYIISTENIGEEEVSRAIALILNSKDTMIISHDIKQLYTWALSYGLDISCKLFDMIIAEYLIDALASGYSIPGLARKYLGTDIEFPFYNKAKKDISEEISGKDYHSGLLSKALCTFEHIYKKQSEILEENNQNSLYYDMELPLSLVLGSMEYYGFRVDKERLEEYGQRLDSRIQSLQQTIWLMAGEEFNINSPKQLGCILFEKLGLRVIKKTKSGYSTDGEVLNDLYYDHDIIPCILEYRQLTKLKSTYVEGLIKVINPRTGRIHSSFNQTVTATGRISSTEPNLQNIPVRTEIGRDIRKAFIPEEGFMFVDADYSQIELRVLAHITGDEMMQRAFAEGIDIHANTASQVFHVPVDQVTPEMRRNAKAVNFGIVYGISDFSLAKDINVTRKEAARYINSYFSTYSKVKKYMDDIVEFARKNGYVETMFHRKRQIPELKSSSFQVRSFGQRIAMNTPIQGSAADIIKIAMVKVWSELKKRNLRSRLILQVHDELLVETAAEELEEVKDIVRRNMEEAVKLSVPLVVDISTGKDWFEAK